MSLYKETNTPAYNLSDSDIEKLNIDYSTRAPTDYVVSGPITKHGGGPGREFFTADDANTWGKLRFGLRYRWRITDGEKGGRWAFLVKAI